MKRNNKEVLCGIRYEYLNKEMWCMFKEKEGGWENVAEAQVTTADIH